MTTTHFTGPVASANGFTSGNTLFGSVAAIEIPSASILTLNTIPVPIIVPAPGFAVVVDKVILYHVAGTAYATSATFEFVYTGTSVLAGPRMSAAVSGLTTATAGFITQNAIVATEFQTTVGLGVSFRAQGGGLTLGTFPIQLQVSYTTFRLPLVS